MAHHLARRLFGGARLVEAAPRLAAVHRLAAGEPRQNRVARRIAEEPGAVARLRARVRVARDYRRHPVRDRLHRVDVLAELQERLHARHLPGADVLKLKRRRLAAVLVVLAVKRRIVAHQRLDVLNHLAERRIGAGVHASAKPHAHFRRVAPAEDVAVLQQQRLHAQARSRQRGAAARHAAADDDEVVFVRIVDDLDAGLRVAPRVHLRRGGRRRVAFGREVERVAAAVEAGEVVEADVAPVRARAHHARLLPVPGRVRVRAELVGAPASV